jgi:hypothetical protein
MRRDFGKLNGGAIEYAPDTLIENGSYIVAPRPADFVRLGFKRVSDLPPPTDADHYAIPVGWAESDTEITHIYDVRENPSPPPRTFRKSWLAQWIYAHGKWPRFVAFLDSPDAQGISFLWSVCTEFDEDNEAWPGAVVAIKEALDLTDAEAEGMLDFGATGGQP